MEPFARTIDAAKKYVVSSTLDRVDWNAELVRGDLGMPVKSGLEGLEHRPRVPEPLSVGGMHVRRADAEGFAVVGEVSANRVYRYVRPLRLPGVSASIIMMYIAGTASEGLIGKAMVPSWRV